MNKINFLYSTHQLQQQADTIIHRALRLGATQAQVELSENIATEVEVLNQNIENFTTAHEHQLLLTVYLGQQKGQIGISNLATPDLDLLIAKALDIAKYTQPDTANGLLAEEFLAPNWSHDLALYSPLLIDNHTLIATTMRLEQQTLSQSELITASDGAATSINSYNFVTATSNGFNNGYQTSRYSNSVSIIGNSANGMQTDYWYSSARNYQQLLDSNTLAKTAAKRLLRRLTPGKFNGQQGPIIFESNIAKSIIGSLIGALSGNALYRKLSFLNDSLGQQILPTWLTIYEDPYRPQGLASCYFDNEGGIVKPRTLIDQGKVAGYLLSAYSARKLNLPPTGNAGGAHNLIVTANFAGDLAQLAHTMHNGLIIIETIGHGLNAVTGDYSVGASALEVVNGEIGNFIDNLTLSGNIRNILHNILNIANDSSESSIICGSMLIDGGCLNIATK